MRVPRPNICFPKLHPLSWCVAGVMTVFVLLVQVAGQEQHDYKLLKPLGVGGTGTWQGGTGWQGGGVFSVPEGANPDTAATTPPRYASEYTHGWPLPWARRAYGFGDAPWHPVSNGGRMFYLAPLAVYGNAISWSYPRAWPCPADKSEWYVVGMLVNLLVACLLIVVPTALCEWWIRSRGRLWRFRIVDMLGLMVMVAAGFGFWRWETQIVEEERQILEMLASFDDEDNRVYVGPDWLRRLVGNEKLIPVLHRVQAIDADTLHESSEVDRALQGLHGLEEICIEVVPTKKQMELLARLPRLRRLELMYGTALGAVFADEPTPDYHLLSQSRSIEEVSIVCNYLIADDLRALMPMPQLKSLSTESACLTNDQIEQLALKHPNLTIEDMSVSPYGKAPDEIARINGLLEQWRRKYGLDRSYVSRVIQLDLTKYALNDDMLLDLIPVLGKRTRLVLDEAEISPEAFGKFCSQTKVTKLRLFGDWLTDRHVEKMQRSTPWEYLTLTQGEASLDSIERLIESNSMKMINIISDKIPKSEIERLRKKFDDVIIYHNGSRFHRDPN